MVDNFLRTHLARELTVTTVIPLNLLLRAGHKDEIPAVLKLRA